MDITKPVKSVLVTGGCGFIGANLVRRLAGDQELFIRVLDDMSCGDVSRIIGSGAEICQGDIRDTVTLRAAMHGIDSVIHLAASGSVIESVEDPRSNFDQNVGGVFSVLEAARKADIRKFVFASTGGALIGDSEPPVNEESLPKPISPYGASKLCGEAYCHAFGQAYGIQTVALRFANVYGPFSAHKKGVVTAFIKALMNDEPLVIYGDGSASRDFLYVDDLCSGIERALKSTVAPGSVFHLASGTGTSIEDLAHAVLTVCAKSQHPLRFQDARRGEVGRNFARFDCAREVLGFEPQWSLRDGLASTWAWFLKQRAEIAV